MGWHFLGEEAIGSLRYQYAEKGEGIHSGHLLSVPKDLYVCTHCNREWQFHCSELPVGAEIDRNHCEWHDLTEHDEIDIYDGEDHSNRPSWVGLTQGYVFVGIKSSW